jgi:hypothetical protein
LSDYFPIQNGLKQKYALSLLLFNFALEYAVRNVQENPVRVKLSGTRQLPAYDNYMHLLGDNIDATKKDTETSIGISKEVGLEVNAEESKYMLSRHQNAGQNYEMKIATVSFENSAQF